MKVSCLGGTRTVTGSCFLCEHQDASFLVDCGMFRGGAVSDRRNRDPFPFDPASIQAVLLTHAHVDHSGLLPRLVSEGFEGTIYATPATVDLCAIMLMDSAHIQEMEAEWQSRRNLRKGLKALQPLYTARDAERTLRRFQRVAYDTPFRLADSAEVCFRDAGHILGSSFLEITFPTPRGEKKTVFSGDLGHPGQFIVRDPAGMGRADFLFLESTYGNRRHKSLEDTLEEFAQILQAAERDRAKIIIPAFAVERTQEILFALFRLQSEKRVPVLPVYVDSPLAISATELFRAHPECFDQETLKILETGQNPLNMPTLSFTRTAEESMQLNALEGPLIIISASGMCDAGRIKHHLKHNLWKEKNHVVIVGFQAEGTLGRKLVDGMRRVRIFQEEVQVNASIHTLGGFSAHADQEALLKWLSTSDPCPERIFLIHGEEDVLQIFAERVRQYVACPVEVPALRDEILLVATREEREEEVRAEDGRVLKSSALEIAGRLKVVSDALGRRTWEERSIQRYQLEKQLRKIRRLTEKLEKMAVP